MLIVFQSKAAADVLMFSKHALTIMQIIGRPYDAMPERGVITHEQLPEAIELIEKAISEDKQKEQDEGQQPEDDDVKVHPIAEPDSFRQRVWPLLSMLRASHDRDVDVMWEPAARW